MSLSWSRIAVLTLPFAVGCDISAHPFAGTIVQMTINGAQASAPNTHLELWATSQYDDIIRINPLYDGVNSTPGIVVVKAVTMSDPCMIHLHCPAAMHVNDAVPFVEPPGPPPVPRLPPPAAHPP